MKINLNELEIKEAYDEEEYYEFLKNEKKLFSPYRTNRAVIRKRYNDKPINPLENAERIDISIESDDLSPHRHLTYLSREDGIIDTHYFDPVDLEVNANVDEVFLKVVHKFRTNFDSFAPVPFAYWLTEIVIVLPESYKDIFYGKNYSFVWEKTLENRKTWTPGASECPYCGEDKFKN